MNYAGTIIEESLSKKNVLASLKILSQKVERTSLDHKTPWIPKWTIDQVEISENVAEDLAQQLSRSIDPKHPQAWYIDFRNDFYHFLIFAGKVFKLDRSSKEEYNEAIDFGINFGIPKHQMEPIRKYLNVK